MDVGLLLLALEDFVPVVLSAFALWFLAATSRRLDRRSGVYVTASSVLIPLGGLSKPTYKMLLALSDGSIDLALLDDVLFWFLAPGFVLLASGLRGAARADRNEKPDVGGTGVAGAAAVVLVAALILAFGSAAWFFVLLGVATLANVAAVVVLVRWARARSDSPGAFLFAGSLVIVFGLAWAAASLEQTIATQWGEQLFSTASQGMVLWGSVRLTRRVGAGPGSQAGAVGTPAVP